MTPTTPRPRAVGYARVSTVKQASFGVSIEAQSAAIAAVCQLRGFDLVGIETDPAVCGADAFASRPGGRRVLELLEQGGADTLVAVALDRVGRDAADSQLVVRTLVSAGVKVVINDMGGDVGVTSFGDRIMLSIRAEIAEEERRKIASRTRDAVRQLRSGGKRYCNHVPLTAMVVTREENGKPVQYVVPNPEMTAAATYAAQRRGEGLSCGAIAKELDRRWPRANGSPWDPTQARRLIQQANGWQDYHSTPDVAPSTLRKDLSKLLA